MTTNTQADIQKWLGRLAKCFTDGQWLTKETGGEYLESLRGPLKTIDLEKLKERLKTRFKKFPAVAEILEEATQMKAQAREWTGGPSKEPYQPMEPTRLEKLLRQGGFAAVADKLKGST